MNENLMQFIKDVGALCEMWTIIYNSFLKQGMNENDALKHTQAFLTATMNSFIGKQNGT
jgi:hypothetical protein